MEERQTEKLARFLSTLGYDEMPFGIFYSDTEPSEGITPDAADLPTREKEQKNGIDWQNLFSHFTCVIGAVWRARKKRLPAYFDAGHFGCPGGAFFLGFMKPQTETMIKYVSSGIPGYMEGELYIESPDELRRIFEYIDPRPAPKKYCILKPLDLFASTEEPELVSFFARPEVLCGLHQLAAFVTHDAEVIASPWGAACTNLIGWPLRYVEKGQPKAVLGGWDPSARKFFKNDELSFTVPYKMFLDMLERFEESFLLRKTWPIVRKKIGRSKKVWGEEGALSRDEQ